jgi:hypothetical protein
MPLKIHANRVEVPPPPGQQHATAWRVAVTDARGDLRMFDVVRVVGEVSFVALEDGETQPRVYAQPSSDAVVHGYTRTTNGLGDPTMMPEELDPR